MHRALAVIALSLLAASASAQSEFDRASGGAITLTTKHGGGLSGSLGLTASGLFGRGYGGTLGGTLVPDRMWFFASAEEHTVSRMTGVNLTAPLTDRQSVLASFAVTRPQATPALTFAPTIPSSFLSLHYTGIVSSNMFFTATVSEHRRSTPPY